MTVAIITDSAASIPDELIAEHGIEVVPMRITLGDETFDDGALEQRAIVERIEGGEKVTTSAPSPGAWKQALERSATDDGALLLTVASTMSATFDAAQVATNLHEGPAQVLDTRTAAGAQGLVVLEAARAAGEGEDLDGVVRRARRAAERVRLVATVGSLEFLVRSGRVPGLAGKAGDALGAKPLFEFRDGEPKTLRPSLGRQNSLDRVVDRWHRTVEDGGRLHVAALHALAPDDAEAMLRKVADEVEPELSFVAPFSTVMVVHTGPALAGLAWWWDR